MVAEFHSVAEQPGDTEWSIKNLKLRKNLIKEEFEEVMGSFIAIIDGLHEFGDVAQIEKENLLKEMADLQYVLSGTAERLGLPLQQAFVRVHKSNMSKFVNGQALRREDGKILKGKNYKAPDLSDLIKE